MITELLFNFGALGVIMITHIVIISVLSFVWMSFQCCLSIGSNLLSLRPTSLLPYLELGHKKGLMNSLCLSQVVVGSELVAVVISEMV